MQPVRLTYLEPKPGFVWTNPPENNYVDKHVFAKLKMLSIPPSDLCTDQEFVRRAYLDLCGILPTPDEAQAFLADTDPDKRAKLIDALLERPEYADFWTLKWSDVLRSSRKTIQLKGTHVFQQWLRDHIEKNTPLRPDRPRAADRQRQHLRQPAGQLLPHRPRLRTDLAETTAQLFFGIRMQCAKCHNHPFERWTQDDYYSMAAFFARVKQTQDRSSPATTRKQGRAPSIIYADARRRGRRSRAPARRCRPKFLGGAVADDRRRARTAARCWPTG